MNINALKAELAADKDKAITHVGLIHCETTTGIVNPLEQISTLCKETGRKLYVDAMSSFGGLVTDWSGVDYVVTSPNKCLQGVPGFSLCIFNQELMKSTAGTARSLALDIHAQWNSVYIITHDIIIRFEFNRAVQVHSPNSHNHGICRGIERAA